ncbi:histone deacetylase family protein [Microvirga sp. 2TAF3]|uniref:histone deacetylase family protein n=1 Tax=Microvirga sp. 2TAF3 TaxID=3233014 RepID=UPI003F9D570B
MLVVHHPDQALHDPEFVFRTGKFIDQPDRAERCRIFLDIVKEDGHQIVQAPLGNLDPIFEIHDRDYVEFLKTVHKRWAANPDFGPEVIPNVHPTHRMYRKPTELLGELGWYSNSTSCPITEGTWPAVYASAQTAIHGADRLSEAHGPVYALCRPPGHHAYPDLMTGVCFLNNAAIAAHRLTKKYGKVALVDIDVHHGNGTQFIFYERADVLFCSIHIDPRLSAPYYAGYADEIGEGAGRGLNFNQPLPWATPDPIWLDAVDAALARVSEFAPGAVVVSLGFDASEHDPVATFKITNDGFAQAGRKFAALNLPTLLVQEGGYLSPHLGGYLRSFLRAVEAPQPAFS